MPGTVSVGVLAPVDHRYVCPPEGVSVAGLPAQVTGELTVIEGFALIVTTVKEALVHGVPPGTFTETE